jgi:hypothetical protein
MTACSYDYRADRIVIAADSAIYDDDGVVHGHGCKVYTLPTIRAVMFARGKLAIIVNAVRQLLLTPPLFSIEDAAAAMPEFLSKAAEAWADSLDIDMPPAGENYMECMLAGWSEAEGRMRNFQFTSADGFKSHAEFDRAYGGPYAWPMLPADYMPLDRSTDPVEQKLVATLRAIDRWCGDNAEALNGVRLGGDMMAVTLTEAGASFSTIGTFDPKPVAPAPQPRKAHKKGRR